MTRSSGERDEKERPLRLIAQRMRTLCVFRFLCTGYRLFLRETEGEAATADHSHSDLVAGLCRAF